MASNQGATLRFFINSLKYFLICLTLYGCQASPSSLEEWKTPNDKIKVLSTTPIINDLVRRIGGERIDPLSLMGSSIDPHSYELVKGDDEKFSIAHVVFCNGLGLEHSASLKSLLTQHPHTLALGDTIRQKNPELILQNQGQVDPHIWLDVSIWKQAITPIVSLLSEIDPSGQEHYEMRGLKTEEELTALDSWMQNQFLSIASDKKYLITSHDAFNYFARRYFLEEENASWKERFCAPEGLAPDGQLGFRDLERVITYLEQHHVEVLFPEANVAQDSLKKIIEIAYQKGITAQITTQELLSDTFADEESYEAMMKHNVEVLCKAWRSP
jgi:manganese/zinc/iron transport system substrate-binding protein